MVENSTQSTDTNALSSREKPEQAEEKRNAKETQALQTIFMAISYMQVSHVFSNESENADHII